MIFADRLIEQEPELHGALLEGTRKIRVHADVYDAAIHLIDQGEDKIKKVAPYAVWPDYETWIEGNALDGDAKGFDYGFLFYGGKEASVTAGYGMAIIQRQGDEEPITIPVYFDLALYEMRFERPDSVVASRMQGLPLTDPLRKQWEHFNATANTPSLHDQIMTAPLLKALKPLIFSLLALMNSPKLVRTREHDHAKLNARRIKRGKYPYYPHHEVVLNIDKHSFMVTQGQGDGPERGLHFVRSHLRFYVHPRYKNVEVTIVQPHWRGNPELGIRNTRYSMERGNSKWNE